MKNTTDIIPYCAGYLDGDGCFYVGSTIQKKSGATIFEYSVQVVSVKRYVLEMLCAHFGGHLSERPKRNKHKPAYIWTVKCQSSGQLVKNVQDFLVDKREAAKLYIEFCDLMSTTNHQTVSEQTLKKRNDLVAEIRHEKHERFLVTKEIIREINESKDRIAPTSADFSYLAGLIDSEGCFRINKSKPSNRKNYVYATSLDIGNARYPVLAWLQSRFGGNVTFSAKKAPWRNMATWSLRAARLAKILPDLCNKLVNKKDVCMKVFEFQSTIIPNGGDRHSERFKALFEKIRSHREQIIQEIHVLNRKGE